MGSMTPLRQANYHQVQAHCSVMHLVVTHWASTCHVWCYQQTSDLCSTIFLLAYVDLHRTMFYAKQAKIDWFDDN